ncbi:MAG: TIGR00159 family protein [bacterium]|nr:TIGR00159 family protein [Deltaproteobacteria bacterium]MCP4908383.1 TIGR00159 family protein [bacterium]
MITVLWEFGADLAEFFNSRFDPFRDGIDILLVTAGIYWLLLLIRGTRAIQILVGMIVLIALSLASQLFQLAALGLILSRLLEPAVLIIVILFQNDIRRALARVGRGFFPSFSADQEIQVVEEIVRTAGGLSQRRHGALIVLERESNLGDLIEAGVPVDAQLSKELLASIFQPSSPMHDGAVVVQEGRVSSAGCILPLTLRTDLPEGLGTRHRAAVGITEETDALVVVVSEETAKISVVLGGEMLRGLEAPQLREVLRDVLGGERTELPEISEMTGRLEVAEGPESGQASAG